MIRSPKLLNAAKGEDCTLNAPPCDNDTKTVVACHSDWLEDGKGRGIKAHDIFIAFGCYKCHLWLGGPAPKEEKRDVFHRGLKKTWKRLIERGLIKLA